MVDMTKELDFRGDWWTLAELVDRLEDEGVSYSALQSRIAALEEAIRDIKAAFDWYHADEYDRCSSVPQDAIEDAMKLVAQPADLKAQADALFK